MRYKESEFGLIPEHWKLQSTIEYCDIITDYVANGSFKSLADNVKYNQGEKYAVLIRLTDYHNEFKGDFIYVDKQAYDFLGKTQLFGEEIVIANVGANVGTVFLVPKLNRKMSLGPNSIMIKTKGNDKFYFYWFKSRMGKGSLQSIITGSAQPKFNKTAFRKLDIPVPPIREQEAIANILSSLDDKIELNNKINQNLETLAQTLYKQWFVDFEFPNENGEPYKSSGGVMVESEMGLIPEGWSVKILDDLSSNEKNAIVDGPFGTQMKVAEYQKSGIPIVEMYQLNGYENVEGYRSFISKEKYEEVKRSTVKQGDIIISKTGTLGLLGTLNRKIEKGILVSRLAKITPNKALIKSNTMLLLMHYLSNSNYWYQIASGSTMPLLNIGNIKKTKVVFPEDNNLSFMFDELIFEMIEMININLHENFKLSKLRDELLPKLMNGEIEVPV